MYDENVQRKSTWSLWKLSFMVNMHFKAAQSFFLGQHALNKVSEIVNYIKKKKKKKTGLVPADEQLSVECRLQNK